MRNLFQQAKNPELEADMKETRPFFYILVAVLIFLYSFAVYSDPLLRQPIRLIPFTFLMVLHGILHWYVAYLTTRNSHIAIYLIVQLIIIITLIAITQQQGIVMGLYLALAGETVGFLGDWRRSLIAAAGFLVLMALNYGLVWGWDVAPQWLGSIVIMLLFVLIYVILYVRQITAREEAQHLFTELQTAHNQLASYAQQVETLTLDAERQRMARELHDTLAQGLAGLVLQLEALEAHLEKGQPDAAYQIVGQAKERARITLANARSAIDDLRNDNATPIEAITHEVARFKKATGIPCHLTLPESLPLSQQNSEHAIRFITEGLANVTRHAQATEVWVDVNEVNNHIHLKIRDNGNGFENSNIATGHYGLLGLRERARLANGTLTIDTAPGKGTMLVMEIPMEERRP